MQVLRVYENEDLVDRHDGRAPSLGSESLESSVLASRESISGT